MRDSSTKISGLDNNMLRQGNHASGSNLDVQRSSAPLAGLSLGAKLALPALLSLTFLIISSALAIFAMSRMHQVVVDLHDVKFYQFSIAQQIQRDVQEVNTEVYRIIAWTASEYDTKQIEQVKKTQVFLIDQVQSQLKVLAGQPALTVDDKAALSGIESALAEYRQVMSDAIGMLDMGLSYATMYFSKSDTAFEKLNRQITDFVANQKAATSKQYEFANSTADQNRLWLLGLLGLSVLAAASLTVYMRRLMLASLAALKQLAGQMQAGDLSSRVQVNSGDEIGVVIGEFNAMLDKLQTAMSGIRQVVLESNAVATLLSDKADEVTHGATEQAKQSASAASIVEKLAKGFKATTSNAHQAESISRASEKICGDAASRMLQVRQTIVQLDGTMEQSAKSITELGARSREIQGITKMIEGIASQTNLLALNAAIEAARAGESRRGFAVVADQVRKLADQTAAATSQIAELVHGVMKGTDTAVATMQRGTQEASDLSASFDEMTNLIETLKKESTAVREISEAAMHSVDAQQQSVRAVAEHIAHIASLASKNSTLSQHSKRESERIGNLAHELETSVVQFRV